MREIILGWNLYGGIILDGSYPSENYLGRQLSGGDNLWCNYFGEQLSRGSYHSGKLSCFHLIYQLRNQSRYFV